MARKATASGGAGKRKGKKAAKVVERMEEDEDVDEERGEQPLQLSPVVSVSQPSHPSHSTPPPARSSTLPHLPPASPLCCPSSVSQSQALQEQYAREREADEEELSQHSILGLSPSAQPSPQPSVDLDTDDAPETRAVPTSADAPRPPVVLQVWERYISSAELHYLRPSQEPDDPAEADMAAGGSIDGVAGTEEDGGDRSPDGQQPSHPPRPFPAAPPTVSRC